MKLSKLIKNLTDVKVFNYSDVNVKALSIVDNTCTKGCMFFAIDGIKEDGKKYINKAIANGAKVVVASGYVECDAVLIVVPNVRAALSIIANVYYKTPQNKLKIIALIGTNGKTTTSHFVYDILRFCGKKVGLIGTIGIKIDDINLPNELTTPDPIELNYYLHQMVQFGCEYCVMEVSAHAIALNKMYGIKIECGIFTNITGEHLDFFKTMHKYAMTKIGYFTSDNMKYAIVNVDDKYGKLIVQDNNITCYTYALYNPADTFAININGDLKQSSFVVNSFDNIAKVVINLPGEYNVYNAIAAITCASVLGINLDACVKALSKVSKVSGRMEVFDFTRNNKVIVDFAHTPDGFEKVLSTITKYRHGRIITLFGCVSYSDSAKRKLMGQIAKKYSDIVILTSDNPDNIDFDKICNDIGIEGNNVYRIKDRKSAIEYGVSLFKSGDTLVCLGKGGEEKQKINGNNIPYNESDIVKNLLVRKVQ